MTNIGASAVVCGAGIAGIAAAYHLSLQLADGARILLIDREPPLSVTSDKSTECYRNWWPAPGAEMVDLVDSSIRQLEAIASETGNVINMNRRGYLFASAEAARVDEFAAAALSGAGRGVGELREHGRTGAGNGSYRPHQECRYDTPIDGCDLITDQSLIRRHFPTMSPQTTAVLHVRRCGWMSAQQLGMWLLEQARARGVELLRGELVAVRTDSEGVAGVDLVVDGEPRTVSTRTLVNAAGPFLGQVGAMLGETLPVFHEAHVKLSLSDTEGAVDREAPLSIWTDETYLSWSDEERAALREDPEGQAMLAPFPAGVHGRPDGTGNTLLLYWPYDCEPVPPTFPIDWDPSYPEVVLRGMARIFPGLDRYFERIPNLYVDGGYYTKTRENRPLVGPAETPGHYLMGAFSGFGIMASLGAGELLAKCVTGRELPAHAGRFSLARYQSPEYQRLLDDWPDSGQL